MTPSDYVALAHAATREHGRRIREDVKFNSTAGKWNSPVRRHVFAVYEKPVSAGQDRGQRSVYGEPDERKRFLMRATIAPTMDVSDDGLVRTLLESALTLDEYGDALMAYSATGELRAAPK